MGNPTDELRARLNELGVEHIDNDYKTVRYTRWNNGGKREVMYKEWSNGTTRLDASNVTPEQAVAATVEVDSNTGKAIRKLLDKLNTELCNAGCIIDCETREERQRLIDAVKDKYAQAIAATVGERDKDECFLMYDGKKHPATLDFGFIGLMPITIEVGGFRYLVEVPNEE